MTAQKWSPTDVELDAVARDLPPPALSADAAEQIRTRMLASAAHAPQLRRSRTMLYAGAAIAAAAAIVIWLAIPRTPSVPNPSIVASADARYERASDWPAYQLRVHEGQLSIAVTTHADRLRVLTSDADVEVQAARFVVEAKQDRLELVRVETGSAIVRPRGSPAVTVIAGSEWRPVRTAVIETTTIEPPAPPAAVEPPAVVSPPAEQPRHTKPRPTSAVAATPAEPQKPEPPPPTTTPSKPEAPPSPGEAAFRKGWSSLRVGDARAATSSFATACSELRGEALGEDACFWLGVAAKRAGNATLARDALAKFLTAFPSSMRAGEASALLGWLLYDANELDAAKRRFDQALQDRAPTVRDSAQRGLTAIDSKRAKP